MSDPRDPETPADPAEAVLDGLEPGTPLADSVERHLAASGGPVPVDEEALQRAVRSASTRIAALEVKPRPAPPSRRGWMAVAFALAAVLILALVVPRPSSRAPQPSEPAAAEVADPGPGITLVDARIAVSGRTLALHEGEVGFHRSDTIRPRVDRIALPDLALTLVPVGTTFRVRRTRDAARVFVTEGSVQVEGSERLLGTIHPGPEGAILSATGVRGDDFSPVPDAVVQATPASPPPAAPPSGTVETVALNPDTRIPAVLVLLLAEEHARTPAELTVAVRAAETVGSTRPLVGLGSRLDPQTVDPEQASVIWFATARARAADGALQEALVAADRIERDHWLHPRGRLLAGTLLAQLGEDAGARVALTEATQAGAPTATAAWYALGRLHLEKDRKDAAGKALTSAGIDSPSRTLVDHGPARVAQDWKASIDRLEAVGEGPDPWSALLDKPADPRLDPLLWSDPELRELHAEHHALEAVRATQSTTLDPETLAALEAATDAHRAAADVAVARVAHSLAAELRATSR